MAKITLQLLLADFTMKNMASQVNWLYGDIIDKLVHTHNGACRPL